MIHDEEPESLKEFSHAAVALLVTIVTFILITVAACGIGLGVILFAVDMVWGVS